MARGWISRVARRHTPLASPAHAPRPHLTTPQILYSDSLRQAASPKSWDPLFLAFSFFVLAFFSFEAGATCVANPHYARRCALGAAHGRDGGWAGAGPGWHAGDAASPSVC